MATWGDFFEQSDGYYEASVNTFAIKDAILKGMRFAYEDAVAACRGEHLEDPTKEADDIAYDLAIEHAAKAIEGRMK